MDLLKFFRKKQVTYRNIDNVPFYQYSGNYSANFVEFQNDTALVQSFYELPELYAPINYLASCIAKINFELWQGEKKLEKHWILDLLRNPNNLFSYKDLTEHFFCDFFVTGKGYLNFNKPTGFSKPENIFYLPSELVTIKTNITSDYRFLTIENFNFNSIAEILPENMLYKRNTNIVGDINFIYGKSPLLSSRYPISSLKASYSAKTQLYQHGAKAILSPKPNTGGFIGDLTEEQAKNETFRINNDFGRMAGQHQYMITRTPLDITQVSPSIRDLDLNANQLADFQAVCKVYNIPSVLLSDNDNSTYNNKKESAISFFESTVLPLTQDYFDSLIFALDGKKSTLKLKPVRNSIPELKVDMEKKSIKIVNEWNAGIIMQNEARKELGYEEISGGDVFKTINTNSNDTAQI